jgi:hypothetical protein
MSLAAGSSTTAFLEWSTAGWEPGDRPLVIELPSTVGSSSYAFLAQVPSVSLEAPAGNVFASIGGRATAVCSFSDRLYLAAGASLEILDPTQAPLPARIGAIRLPGVIRQITAGPDLAVAACGQQGISLVSTMNPSVPMLLSVLPSAGYAYGVAYEEGRLYVADGRGGVRVWNVAAPGLPVLLGQFQTDGPAIDLQVQDSTAFVLDQHQGLTIVDFSSPGSPGLLGRLPMDAGLRIALNGSRIYLLTGNRRLEVIDVAQPRSPRSVGQLTLAAPAQSLIVHSNMLWLAGGRSGLLAFQLGDPSHPVQVGSYPTDDEAFGVLGLNTRVYTADGFGGLRAFHLKPEGTLENLGSLTVATRAADVAWTESIACVASGEGGLQLFEFKPASLPARISVLGDVRNARGISAVSNVVYVADGQYGFKVVDITQPTQPKLVASLVHDSFNYLNRVAVWGRRAVIADGFKIHLLDLTQSDAPGLLDTLATPGYVFDLVLSSNRVLAATGASGLWVGEITAQDRLAKLSTVVPSGPALSLSASGTSVFVAFGNSGWQLLNLADPLKPVLVWTSSVPASVTQIRESQGLAWLGTDRGRIQVMDVRVPLTPVSLKSFGLLTRIWRLGATKGRLLAAEDDAGLSLLEVDVEEDQDQDHLPDDWEQTVVDTNPDDELRSYADVRGEDDLDGDGLTNYQEFLAGTAPLDPGSVFTLGLHPGPEPTAVTLSWFSAAGKQYTLLRSTNLISGFSVVLDSIPATPPLNQITDECDSSEVFYMIQVK